MNTHPITRTIVTESGITLNARTATLDDLRAFVRDTESMDGKARLRVAYRDGGFTTEHASAVYFIRATEKEQA